MLKSNRTKFNPVSLDHPVNDGMQIEHVYVTPGIARQMLARNENNRNLRPNTVATYARDMQKGNWRPTAETIKFDWHGRLIDGQHRLHAVIAADVSVGLTIARNLDPEAQTVLDMGARRTAADALAWDGVSKDHRIIAAAARISMAHAAGQLRTATSEVSISVSNSEVLEWVDKNPLIHDAAALGRRVYREIGGTPSVFAYIAFRLMSIDTDAAIEFLTSTAEFRTSGASDPRSALIRTLTRLKSDRARIIPATQIALVFRAWNAWRSDRGMSSMMVKTASGGVTIPEPK